ncbi:MAG TPA: helix-turn-helix domain-containing protein [Tepidisphaeraceae bacterium]
MSAPDLGAELPSAQPQTLLTEPEAAAILRISQRKLWDLADRGEIPVIRINRRKLYDPADIRDFCRGHKVNGRRNPINKREQS